MQNYFTSFPASKFKLILPIKSWKLMSKNQQETIITDGPLKIILQYNIVVGYIKLIAITSNQTVNAN